MVSFCNKKLQIHDNYMTPKSAWEAIKHYIPKNKIIWEAFYGDGKSGSYLKELGFQTIHRDIDFFKNNLGDIIISNPPFQYKKEVLIRLKELNKPFIIICPCAMLITQYFKNLFQDEDIKILIPRRRIQFIKIVNGEEVKKNKCNFDCFYYCWKIHTIEKNIVWLDK